MSFTTRNAAGLFGSAEGDLNALDTECPSHIHWGTCGARSAIGGITPCISHALAAHFDVFEEFVPMVARCHGIRCRGRGVDLMIINLHLEPILTHSDKTKLLNNIHNESKNIPGFTVLIGDFNFIYSDEARRNIVDPLQAETTSNPKLAACVESLFSDFT